MNLQHCETCNTNIIAFGAELHRQTCSLKHRKKQPPMPDDIEELKFLLKQVLKRVDMLTEEVENLKKNQTTQKRKRISDILNERDCTIGIREWINQIAILDEDIDRILRTTNIIIGMKTIFEKLCLTVNKTEIPIAAFIQKENKLYLYDNDNTKWRMASKKDIIKQIIDSLRSKFIIAFNEWPKEQYKKYGKPEYELFAIAYGSKYKDNDIATEISKILFSILKINLEKDTIDDLEE